MVFFWKRSSSSTLKTDIGRWSAREMGEDGCQEGGRMGGMRQSGCEEGDHISDTGRTRWEKCVLSSDSAFEMKTTVTLALNAMKGLDRWSVLQDIGTSASAWTRGSHELVVCPSRMGFAGLCVYREW